MVGEAACVKTRLPEFFVEYLFLSPAELPENRRFRPAASRLERYFLCEKGEGEFSHRLVGPPSMTCSVDPTEAVDASLRRHDGDDTQKSRLQRRLVLQRHNI